MKNKSHYLLLVGRNMSCLPSSLLTLFVRYSVVTVGLFISTILSSRWCILGYLNAPVTNKQTRKKKQLDSQIHPNLFDFCVLNLLLKNLAVRYIFVLMQGWSTGDGNLVRRTNTFFLSCKILCRYAKNRDIISIGTQ